MNAKKTAIKGLIAVAVLVALCIFFSGTIRSIATAKVKIAQPRQGKLTQTVELKGELIFLKNTKVYIPGAEGVTLDIKTVEADTGSQVDEGDTLFTAEVSGFDETMAQYKQAYVEAEDSLTALKDKKIRLKRTDEAWAEAYAAVTGAREKALDADIAFRARMTIEELTMDGDELPEKASDDLAALFEERNKAQADLAAAQEAMTNAERYSVSAEVKEYVTEKMKQEAALKKAEDDMLALTVLNQSVACVKAVEDGYITAMNAKAGESFEGSSAAYTFCPEDDKPVLRLDASDCPLTISKGMDVLLVGKDGQDVECDVSGVGMTTDGEKYADVKLDKRDIKDLGGTMTLASSGAAARVEYKAKQSTTLLPAAAVRGSGDDRYVFVIRTEESAFGTQKTVVARQDVTVLAESDGVVSVEDGLMYVSIAYMEDRGISDGDAVMEYED